MSFKDELVHYFLHNEIKEGKAKDIASVIYEYVPNPHIMPIQILKQCINEKNYRLLFDKYVAPPVLPPVNGEERQNTWVMEVVFTYGNFFRFQIRYFNVYEENLKQCYLKVNRSIQYKRKEAFDDKAYYYLRDLILTSMHRIKKGCMNKVFGSYWMYCGQKLLPGLDECKCCVQKRINAYFEDI